MLTVIAKLKVKAEKTAAFEDEARRMIAMQAFFAAMPGILDGRPELEMYEEVAGTRR